jgi:gliding motility-associated-like protein
LNDYLSIASTTIGVWESVGSQNRINGSLFNVVDLQNEEYEFTFTTEQGCIAYLTLGSDCIVLGCATIDDISKVVTANGDGYNDTFSIGEVLDDGGCKYAVKIFNRWGKIVFESDDYQNNWGGYHNNSGLTLNTSAKLPTGTYYYIVNTIDSGGDALKPITGYIYLGTN